MSKKDAISLLNSSVLDNKGVLQWILVQMEGAFGGTYFRDIYSGVHGKW